METSTISLKRHFDKIGARVMLNENTSRDPETFINLDIVHDKKGSLFSVEYGMSVNVIVLDFKPKLKHLLLMVRGKDMKSKFLCGHDERDWFVAAVPENKPVTTVLSAMESLKPEKVLLEQSRRKVKQAKRNKRKNDAFIRQGEWFFLPVPELDVPDVYILANEPLRRGSGKPHIARFLYRSGGETVYVNREYPNGVTQKQLEKLMRKSKGRLSKNSFRVMKRDPDVYVKGTIRHPDHKTIHLDFWHRVCMNTESESSAMRHMAFLD